MAPSTLEQFIRFGTDAGEFPLPPLPIPYQNVSSPLAGNVLRDLHRVGACLGNCLVLMLHESRGHHSASNIEQAVTCANDNRF